MRGRGGYVLLVGDEPVWAQVLTEALTVGGHGVHAVRSGKAARAAVEADPPDLVVLDLILPDEDGLVLCADLKAALAVPVLICSGSRRRPDAVLGLKLGADDFVTKPCNVEELLQRVGVLLRARPAALRPAAEAAGPEPHKRAAGGEGLVLDRVRRVARLGAAVIALTPAQYRLLVALFGRLGEPVSRSELARAVFGRPGDDGRPLEVLVWRLRGKLAALGPGGPRIETARGLGYVLLTTTR